MSLIKLLNENIDGKNYYHGSPYNFDKFSISRIGTGNGKQANGWGIYLTTDKDSAKNYGNYIYEVTLDNNNEYNFIDLKKPVEKDMVCKIVKSVYTYFNKNFDLGKFNLYYDYIKNNSLPKVDFNDYELIQFDYMGFLFYKTLSRALGGDKKASLFLNSNNIIGLKQSISKNRTDYVIFDENVLKIKQKEYIRGHYW